MLTIVPLFIGTSELLLIGALVLLLFGGKKLPEMMRGLGQGVKAFKEGMKEPEDEGKEKEGQEKEGQEQVPQAPKETAQPDAAAEGQEPEKEKPTDGQAQ